MSYHSAMGKRYVIGIENVGLGDVARVGGKNAALGEMMRGLSSSGIRVPGGFAVTVEAYKDFLTVAGIAEKITRELAGIKKGDVRSLAKQGAAARRLILNAALPVAIEQDIRAAYRALARTGEKTPYVAVRSRQLPKICLTRRLQASRRAFYTSLEKKLCFL